jgi:hypothetical protein
MARCWNEDLRRDILGEIPSVLKIALRKNSVAPLFPHNQNMKRLLLAAAIALALAGGVVYLVWQTSWAWWIGTSAVIPLFMLLFDRDNDEGNPDAIHFYDPGSGPGSAP